MTTAESLAERATLAFLEPELAQDIVSACNEAIRAGVEFPCKPEAEAIFRYCVRRSITAIEGRRGELLRGFLLKGPYEKGGRMPPELEGARLSDEETGQFTAFLHSFMVNAFKGKLAELLALRPCTRILIDVKARNLVPNDTRLWFGEVAASRALNSSGLKEASDMHLLSIRDGRANLFGLVEVKSFVRSRKDLLAQLATHRLRLQHYGLTIRGTPYSTDALHTGLEILTVTVTASNWRIPSAFRFVEVDGRTLLDFEAVTPPIAADVETELSGLDRHVRLRWSREALAAAGYALTFWYVEQIGEQLHAEGRLPIPAGMTPAEAAIERTKAQLFYAYLRAPKHPQFPKKKSRPEERAIAVCNCYSFGYGVGMNFRDQYGHREMLFVDDLEELTHSHVTARKCRLA